MGTVAWPIQVTRRRGEEWAMRTRADRVRRLGPDRSGPPRGAVAVAALVLVLMWTGSIGRAAWAKDPIFATMAVAHDTSGSEAPGFTLATPEGQTLALSSFRGRVVFLNFWATWCPPCRLEMPSMERLHQEFKDQGLAILAVDIEESPKLVAKFMREFRLTFPALLDSDSRVSSRYAVRGLPTTVLIDRRGRIAGRAIGPREWTSPEGRALIRSLLERG